MFNKLFFRTKTVKTPTNEGGFVILAVPVVLALFGFFVSSIIKDTKPNQFYFEVETQQKLENLRTALATYAHRNYRVPCPADPQTLNNNADFGVEEPVDSNTNKCDLTKGIVPFKTLGLSEDYAKDAWGFYLTYKVSPDFTTVLTSTNTDQFEKKGQPGSEQLIVPVDSGENYLHQLCRTANWTNVEDEYWDSSGQKKTKTGATNENIFKARFCCASNLNASSSSSQTFHAADEAKHEHGRSVVFGDNNEITMTADGLDIGNLRQLRNKSGNLMTGLSYDRDLKTQAVFDFQPHMTTGGHGFGLLRIAYNPYKNNNLNSFSIGQTGKGKCVIIPDENREVCVNNDTHIINSSGGRHNFHNIGHSDHDLSGKFVNAAAVLQIDSSVRTNELSVTISDVANNRAHPVFVSLSLTTSDGTPLDINMNGNEKFGMTLAAPRYPTDGTGELKISLNQFKSNQNPYDNPSAKIEGGLYHAQYTGQYKNNYNAAKEMFRESRTALMNALGINPNAADAQTLLDTAIDGLRIDTAKINAAPSSISFQSISYGSSSAPTQTAGNLVILDEDGNPRIDPRDPDDYASAENNLTVGDTINATYEAAAYAVISHGSDGEGSYLVDGTVNQIDNVDETVANAEHPFEIANHATADIDVTIYDVRKIKSNVPSQNFDDIVMWDSQITLYKALRNGTCTSSQAL